MVLCVFCLENIAGDEHAKHCIADPCYCRTCGRLTRTPFQRTSKVMTGGAQRHFRKELPEMHQRDKEALYRDPSFVQGLRSCPCVGTKCDRCNDIITPDHFATKHGWPPPAASQAMTAQASKRKRIHELPGNVLSQVAESSGDAVYGGLAAAVMAMVGDDWDTEEV